MLNTRARQALLLSTTLILALVAMQSLGPTALRAVRGPRVLLNGGLQVNGRVSQCFEQCGSLKNRGSEAEVWALSHCHVDTTAAHDAAAAVLAARVDMLAVASARDHDTKGVIPTAEATNVPLRNAPVTSQSCARIPLEAEDVSDSELPSRFTNVLSFPAGAQAGSLASRAVCEGRAVLLRGCLGEGADAGDSIAALARSSWGTALRRVQVSRLVAGCPLPWLQQAAASGEPNWSGPDWDTMMRSVAETCSDIDTLRGGSTPLHFGAVIDIAARLEEALEAVPRATSLRDRLISAWTSQGVSCIHWPGVEPEFKPPTDRGFIADADVTADNHRGGEGDETAALERVRATLLDTLTCPSIASLAVNLGRDARVRVSLLTRGMQEPPQIDCSMQGDSCGSAVHVQLSGMVETRLLHPASLPSETVIAVASAGDALQFDRAFLFGTKCLSEVCLTLQIAHD